MSKSKKRILAGVMSLLLLLTSVFTGNVVIAKAENVTEISEDKTIDSTISYDELVVKSGKILTISGTTGESEPVVVTIGNTLTVEESGSVVALNNAVLALLNGATASGIDLYADSGSLLSNNGTFTNQSGDFMAFDWDGTKWILHVESWEPSYNEFNPDKTNDLYMIELKNCNASCGSVSFGTLVEASKVNPGDENESKSLFQGSTVIISFTPIAGEVVDRIQIGQTDYRPGTEGFVPPSNMSQDGETFTYTTQASNFDENGYLRIEVDFTGGGNGANSYGKDGRLAFNIANSDKGDVYFQIGEGTKYRVGGDETNSEETIIGALQNTEIQAGNTIKVWAAKYGGKVVGNFDIRIDGTSVFATDDARTSARTDAEGESGYTITVPAGYASTQLIEFQIEFRDETSGGNNGVNSYGKDDKLAFNIANSDKGDVLFQIGEGTKYRVGGDETNSEETIIGALKNTEIQAGNTIKVWAAKYGGKVVGNFDIRIEGASVFATDDARTAARTDAEGESGYTFTVPAGYASTQLIEFQIEFRDETSSGGGDNDVTYTEDATISADTTKNDITVSAGTLTIDNCSLRVDHKLVVESGATIAGTSASSKLVFAGGAFSNGIELYYQDEKISDDTNNYYSNNGNGPVEFIWNNGKWVTEQQPEEGGGDAPWYTVSYGNSANLTTENGQVYVERIHVGDITYSSIASEYNASDTDKIYSMEDTIFHQKTPEEENDPNYEDPLMAYGIGGCDGDIFIRSDVSGVSIDFKFIPDFGYQLTNIYTNENETDSLLNEFTAAEAVSSFTFNVIQGGNVHFEVKFEKVDNKVTGNAEIASSAKIESTNAAASGTLEMKVDNATASSDIPSGSEALAAYDITLTNVVSKGGDRGSWDTPLEDLGENVATVTLTVDDTTSYAYSVIREHEGENPVTLEATVTDGAISFDTNKFSKYTIVKTPIAKSSIEKAEITLGDALTYNGETQTQTVSSVKIGKTTLAASTDYTVSGNEKKDAGTYTLTITGTGNYTGTATKEFTISKATPTITLSNLSETTQAPTGVKASISPEDATAEVVIEYQVELSANGQTTKQWVTTRPAVAGTYPVRAYLPEATANLAVVAEADAVTGTYTLTQYTAPVDDTNNTTDDSQTTDTTDTEETVENTTTTTTTKKPVTTTEENKTETTPEKTTGVSSKDGSEGWKDIKEEIKDKLVATGEEAVVTVEMNGEDTVPADVFETIKGQDITVSFDMGNGIVWAVNGMDVTADSFEDINFSASTGDGVTVIPAELILGLTEDRFSMELTLEYEGEFGFTAVMSVNVDKKNAGKYANLFYFNPKTKTMEFICSAPVKEDGTTDLTFTHASDYVIVVDEVAMSAANNITMDKVEQSAPKETPVEIGTIEKDVFNPFWIIVIGIVVLLVGGIAILTVKKKNE